MIVFQNTACAYTNIWYETNVLEAVQSDHPSTAFSPEQTCPPVLEVLSGISNEISYMLMLLRDGNRRIIDYNGSAESGETPRRFIDPRLLA